MWFKVSNKYICHIEKFAYYTEKLTNGALVTLPPGALGENSIGDQWIPLTKGQ